MNTARAFHRSSHAAPRRRRVRELAAALAATSVAACSLGASSAWATTAPELISPASDAYTKAPLAITYELPEEAAGGTVEVTLLGPDGYKVVLVLTAAEFDAAGQHTLSLNPADLEATPGVTDETPGEPPMPDGAYEIDLAYENTAREGLEAARATGVKLVTSTGTPTLTAPVDGSEWHGPFTVKYSLPEEAQASSLMLVVEDEAGTHTLTLNGRQQGEHELEVVPWNLLMSQEVLSVTGASTLKSGSYKLRLTYQDFLGNAPASSRVSEVTLETRCARGYYSTSGEAPCKAAEPGYWVGSVGATSQIACEAGTYNPYDAAVSCLPAPEGRYAPAASAFAILCPAGTHDPHEFSTTAAACAADALGTWSGVGAAQATLCEAGTFAPNPESFICEAATPGHYVEAEGASSQRPCPGGSYTGIERSTACTLAPVGFYAPEAATAPVPCPEGTEASTEGQAQCTAITAKPPAQEPAGGGSTATGPGDATTASTSTPTATPSTESAASVLGVAPAPAPAIAALRIDRPRFARATLATKAGHGHAPLVSYELSAGARVRYSLYLSSASTAKGGCEGARARCTALGHWTSATLKAGRERATLASILASVLGGRRASAHAHGRAAGALKPGVYVLTAQALGAQGAKSRQASLVFAVLAR